MLSDGERGRLDIDAGAGVGFRILNAKGNEVQRGTGRWSEAVAPGIYAVQWFSATDNHETLVRVSAGMNASAVYQPIVAATDGLGIVAAYSEVPKIVKGLHRSRRLNGSTIAIIVVRQSNTRDVDVSSDLRLLDTREVELEGSENPLHDVGLEGRISARCFEVRPGLYLLTYRGVTGETLQQTVPALSGRQTMVFLEVTRGDVLLPDGETFVRMERTGIDPTRTVMISVDGSEADFGIRERLRLTRLLLSDLSTGIGTLTDDFVDILYQPQTDPLLKLLGTLTVISHVEAKTSPLLDEQNRNVEFSETGRWLRHARSWLSSLQAITMFPDTLIANWQLNRILTSSWPEDGPSSINIPPMYACAWRWASARSAEQPNAIRRYAAIRAATRGRNIAEPWLTWKAAASIAELSSARSGDAERIEALAQSVAEKSRQLFGDSSYSAVLAEFIERAGPEAGMVAMQANTISRSVTSKNSLSSDLASALSIPGRTLRRYLDATNQQLVELLANEHKRKHDNTGLPTGEQEAPSHRKSLFPYPSEGEQTAPGIAKLISNPDDPQKGRFGGKTSRKGYRAGAEFSQASSPGWTRISLLVEGRARDGDSAFFFLHDSFPKDVLRAEFKGGTAQVSVTSWGGFTVGIWLPHDRVELELDLALLQHAPKAIRTR